MKNEKYNGWKNYETWNIALWIGNDPAMYSIASRCIDYVDFVLKLKGIGIEQTPDQVFLAMRGLDIKRLNELINETKE